MRAPPGAWQRAALVAVPLALGILIFVTPGLMGRQHPQSTDIPFLLVTVTGRPWNDTVNETALLYIQSALALTVYRYIEIAAGDANATIVANVSYAPSLALKVPVVDTGNLSVTTLAVKEGATFRYNATVGFVWAPTGWTLRVLAEGTETPRDSAGEFRTIMRREVVP